MPMIENLLSPLNWFSINTPDNFEGSFTATFDKDSLLFKKLLNLKKSNVQFYENETGFLFPISIKKLKKNDPKWQYTFWHNFFFNPALNENIEILFFSPLKNQLSQIS